MIYCVVPEELSGELYDRLNDYYADDPNVKVIVDRRKGDRRARVPRAPTPSSGSAAIGVAPASPASSRPSRPSEAHPPPPGVRVVAHVDGGARGNPGPAAIAAVLAAPDGELLEEAKEAIGSATNNVAEYRAVLLALERARALGADEIEIVGDSELVAKQIQGLYKVKHPAMRPLHLDAMSALRSFRAWSIRTVPRAQNAHADALVNQALDAAA